MGPIYSIADIMDMLRRRVGLISAVVIAGCFGSIFWALSTPHTYISSEVIQIEQPKISDDLARSTIDSSAARRLQLIEQQLMARGNLEDMIAEFGLYTDLPGLLMSEKVDLLRQSVTITGVAAVTEGPVSDGAISVLTITAEMGSRETARDIASAFADETREMAAAQRRNQSRETLEFFQRQEEAMQAEIAAQEAARAAFGNENDLSIEGSLEFRRSELGSLNDALLELEREIIAAQLDRDNIDRSGNTRAATVQREEEELDRLLDSLKVQRQLLQDRRTELSETIETRPEVERTLAEFERRMDQLRDQLDVITTRRSDAEVGFTLENAARGERFVTLEKAQLADFPASMSRKLMVAMGVVASLFLGLFLAFLLELRRPVIRTATQMHRETGLLPVVSIPEAKDAKERKGLSKFWQDRQQSGLQGRAARLARNQDVKRS